MLKLSQLPRIVWVPSLGFFLGLLAPCVVAQSVPGFSPAHYQDLSYRHIGPVGNRVSAVAGVAGDPLTYYAGAASGGIWKSEDGGEYWSPIFDGQPDHAIGALGVAPSDPQIVWAGTGEPHIRSNVSIGTGIYKSTDGGENWSLMGLQWPSRTARIIIHPTNPEVVYVAALGHSHGPQRERGIYRTRDGGKTWEHVLFVDENTGASSLEMDPNNPRILFAGMWQVEIHTWGRESGGPGGGIYTSRDGGDTWTRLEGNGLPTLPVGKVDVCLTPADSKRVYALIETGDGVPWNGRETESGELWRSEDGGKSWALINHSRDLGGRTGYYNNCVVLPDDPDEVFFLTAAFMHSIDGGVTATSLSGRQRPGGDYHDLWIDPSNGNRMIVGNDGGTAVTNNRGKSWHRVQLPIAQMYHVTVDNAVPYHVMGNRQDGPSSRGPSRNLSGGGIPRGMWHSVGGGESGFATPDPTDPNIIWSSASGAGARGGIVVRYNETTRQFRQVEVWPESTGGWPAAELKYRFQWTFPLLISPHDNKTVYVTSQVVHRTRNEGQSWDVISPDLTTNDKSKQTSSGGLTPDNIGVEYCCVIYAFDESPVEQGILWAGSNDGLVHVSRDGGQNWTHLTQNIPDLPPDGVVRSIDASKWAAGKAYLAIEHHQQGNFDPHVYRTENFGASWQKIVRGISRSPLSYVRAIHEDPVRPGLLYLGTENAVYLSFDDGDHWQAFQNNLPASPVYGLIVQPEFNDLVVGTYGRGFWILDDLTPLQQWTAEVEASDAHLFQPRHAYRFRPRTAPMSMPNDPSAGQNPAEGASINYWLAKEASSRVEIEIQNSSGASVRRMTGTGNAGLNRLHWNFRGEPSEQIRLRTQPTFADWLDLGEDRWRPAPVGSISVVEPPGTYTVILHVDGQQYRQSLEVRKDPASEGTLEGIATQTEMVRELRQDLNHVAEAINQVEWVRRQLEDLKVVAGSVGGQESIASVSDELAASFVAVEEKLLQLKVTGTGQDRVRYPTMLAGHLSYLAGVVAVADFPPTDQHREVHRLLKQRANDLQEQLNGLLSNDLPAFNRALDRSGLPRVVVKRQ